MTDDMLTTQRAAERLGISVRRVQALIKSSQLPATKLGRDWVIRADDLEAFAKLPRHTGRPGKK